MNLKPVKDKTKKIYNWLRNPGASLSQRVIHGGVWVFGLQVVNRGFGLIRTVVLARLLAPNDFGLFGVAMLALSSLESFSITGFDQALIQKKKETDSYLDTAWTVQVIRGVILGIILMIGAPLVGLFFGAPKAILIVRVLGIAEVLKSLRNVGVVYFQKELEFHKQFLYQFGGTFVDLAVALPIAFILRSVWALVLGLLARNLIQSILSYKIHDFRPRFEFDKNKAKELVDFGKWVLGSTIVVFIATQGDDIFLGKVLGTTALGFYQLAYRISNTPATEITHVISQVTFPAYSTIQDDFGKLKSAFMKTLSLTTSFSIPLSVGIFMLIPEFTEIFLGEKWISIINPVRILAIAGAIRSITAVWGALYNARGVPNYAFAKNILRVIFTFSPIYFLAKFLGLSGVSIAVLLGIVVTLGYDFYYVKRKSQLDLKSREILRVLFFPFLASIPFLIFLIIIKNITMINWMSLFFIIIVSVVLYIVTLNYLKLVSDFSIIQDVIRTVNAAKDGD